MNGKLITPQSVGVPAGLSIIGLELPGGIGPFHLRDLYIGIALHAIIIRDGPRRDLGALAVAAAEAVLAARSPAPARSPEAPAGPAAG